MGTKYRNFIYNPAHRLVFAYVPKVACTNWKCVLRALTGAPDWLDSARAHDRRRSGLQYLDQQTAPEAILNDSSVRKFACVRHPRARALSAYLNKIEHRLPGHRGAAFNDHFSRIVAEIDSFRQTCLDSDLYPAITFEVFLRWLEAGSYFTQDEHWRPQVDLLCLGHVRFDFIGRFETLAQDADHILAQIKSPVPFPSPAAIKFAPSGTAGRLRSSYTPACQALVARIYARDFQAFGYECAPL